MRARVGLLATSLSPPHSRCITPLASSTLGPAIDPADAPYIYCTHALVAPMQIAESSAAFLPALCARFGSLVWSCLDHDLPRSAVFYAERYFALDQENHDSRHLYATALLHAGQTHSALCAVNPPREKRCPGCDEVRAKCLSALGRHREALEALEECMSSESYAPSRAYFAFCSRYGNLTFLS